MTKLNSYHLVLGAATLGFVFYTASCSSDSESDPGSGGNAGTGGGAAGTASGGSAGDGSGGGGLSGSGGVSGSGGTAGAGGAAGGGGSGNTGGSAGASGEIPTEANLRVAFIGDSGMGTNFIKVLNLIKNEGADFVLHQGDFDYKEQPKLFFTVVNGVLGSNYPYFGSVGNHDDNAWAGYSAEFIKRMKSNGVTIEEGDLTDENYAFNYKGLKVVLEGENGKNAAFAKHVDDHLKNDKHIWKVCSWHKNQKAMQVGGKGDEMGWGVYENCRKYGAIIATGHEHSYSRTRTLTNMQNQTVDAACKDPAKPCVGPGRTFAFVSGLGGVSIREQKRCKPTTFPYGCNKEWAFIYTSDQNADYGALFIDFNVNGDPKQAKGYFKTVGKKTVDQFTITRK